MLNAWYGLVIETLNMFKVDKSDEDAMRVHESWRSNESEIVYSHQPTLIDSLACLVPAQMSMLLRPYSVRK